MWKFWRRKSAESEHVTFVSPDRSSPKTTWYQWWLSLPALLQALTGLIPVLVAAAVVFRLIPPVKEPEKAEASQRQSDKVADSESDTDVESSVQAKPKVQPKPKKPEPEPERTKRTFMAFYPTFPHGTTVDVQKFLGTNSFVTKEGTDGVTMYVFPLTVFKQTMETTIFFNKQRVAYAARLRSHDVISHTEQNPIAYAQAKALFDGCDSKLDAMVQRLAATFGPPYQPAPQTDNVPISNPSRYFTNPDPCGFSPNSCRVFAVTNERKAAFETDAQDLVVRKIATLAGAVDPVVSSFGPGISQGYGQCLIVVETYL